MLCQFMLNADFIISAAGFALLIGLWSILLSRRLHLSLPFFFSYIGFLIVITAVGLWEMTHSIRWYFSLYWVTELTSGVLELLVLHEAFMPALWMEYRQAPRLRLVPAAVLASVIGYAVWQGIYHPFGHGRWFAHFASGLYGFELGVHLLETGVFLLMLKLARRENHPLRHPFHFAVVAGLGIFACSALLLDLARGNAAEGVLRYIQSAVYIGITVGWVGVFARPEPPRQPAGEVEINRRLAQQHAIFRQLPLRWLIKPS